jgi:GTP-binding protein
VRFRHARTIKASDGERGGDKEMNGASGEDTIVQVPIGTVLTDVDTGEIIVDMCMPGQVHTLCEGGRGGF